MAMVNFDAQGRIYSAQADRYEITRWDQHMDGPDIIIRRDYEPIANSQGHLNALVDSLTRQIRANPALAQVVTRDVLHQAVASAQLPPSKVLFLP